MFLCRSSFKNSQKRQKTISIPHWYRYGLSKNEQSKFGLIPGGGGGVLKEGTCGKPHHCGLTLSSPHPGSDENADFFHQLFAINFTSGLYGDGSD